MAVQRLLSTTTSKGFQMRFLIAFLAIMAVGIGCSKKKVDDVLIDQIMRDVPTPVVYEEKDESQIDAIIDNLEARRISPIQFDFNSYQITREGAESLEDLARYMQDNAHAGVTFNGHTCQMGSAEYNMGLSIQRAFACQKWLVDWGIDPVRISCTGWGEEQPIIEDSEYIEDKVDALAPNRRSEIAW